MNPYVFESEKPVIETKLGKVRGVTYGNCNIFMGLPYAKAKRFEMPEELEPWEGVKDCFSHGPIAPQINKVVPFPIYRGLHLLQREGENCQNLNIWAPVSLNDRRMPVFVWIHGGGYFAGNALEEYSFEGLHLANYGGIVFVSINHRLNVLGHLNLDEYGGQFAHSVNAGIADLVLALKWIHENIAAFGGDPDNVTICGHSGGGGKVQCLYNVEEAAPYFQRGICLSGAMGDRDEGAEEKSHAFARQVVSELGLAKETIGQIQEIPYEALAEACRRADRKLHFGPMIFSPVKDDFFHGNILSAGFMPWSADKPMLFGSTLGEFPLVNLTTDQKDAMSQDDKLAYVKALFGDHGDEMVELFKRAYPNHDILDLAYTDFRVRIPTVETALMHARNGKNNTYVYNVTYDAPENGWIPLWHGGDVCYIFRNQDRVYVLNEAIYGNRLENIFSNLVLSFARTGDPNNRFLPEWKPMTAEHQNTMIIDRTPSCREAYDEELVRGIETYGPKFTFHIDL